MLRIGIFSKLANVSIRMLRHYDEIGLLIPNYIDENSGYRYYSAKQLEIINKIQKLKTLGFSLTIIKEILYQGNLQDIEHFFEIRKLEIEEELERIKKQSMLLDEVKGIMGKEDIIKYLVVYKKIPKMNIVSIRKKIATFYHEQDLWNELNEKLMNQKINFKKSGMAMTIYHDKEYKDSNIDIEVALQVEYSISQGELKKYEMEEQKVASVTFDGSYEQMPLVTQAVVNWAESEGYELNGKMIHIFHVSPAQDKNEKNWITEACFLIEKEGEKDGESNE